MQSEHGAMRDSLPDNFSDLEEFWAFWDTHSSADYEDDMETVTVEIEPFFSKMYLPVARDLLSKLRVQARRQGVSPETLVNLWLQERLATSA